MSSTADRGSLAGDYLTAILGHTVTRFVRWLCLAHAAALTAMAYGPLFDHDEAAWQNPVFGSLFRFASPEAWGLAFSVAAALMLVAAISARAAVYLVATVLAALTVAAWAGLVILEALTNPAAVLTSTAIGLYAGTLTSIIGLAFSPRQLEAQRPLELVTGTDTEPIPLRRTASR